MEKDFDDETLMAYADGELSPDMVVRVERAIAVDPAVASRVALFERTRRIVAEDAAAHPAPPVPDAVRDSIHALAAAGWATERSNVVALAVRPGWQSWQLPIAASLALAIGVGAGMLAGGSDGPAPGLQIASVKDPELVGALETLPSGQRLSLSHGTEVAAIGTFRNGDGELCREFEYGPAEGARVVSVACRSVAGWDVRLALAGAAIDTGGYAPASSPETLDAYAASIGAGAPMSLEEERAALSAP
ncbi:MAG: anti-sigma factor family protein [Alphaproteobacteria bacterium]